MAEPPAAAASHSAQRQPRHEDGEAADGAKAAVEGDCACTSDGKDSDGRTSLTRSTSKTLAVAANMQCGICMDILHKCVTLLPCLHNFCAGCYSDWMAKSDGCPQCREVVEEVSRNHTLNNIIEAFVIANPQLKRDADDLESLDARDKLPAESLRPKKRQCSASRGLGGAAPGGEDSAEDSFSAAEDSFSDDDDGFEEWLGHQCVNCARPAPNGFICPTARTADQHLDTRHHNCDFCLQNFPNSATAPPSGSCGGCNRVWCGPYMRWFAPPPATDFLADAPMHQAGCAALPRVCTALQEGFSTRGVRRSLQPICRILPRAFRATRAKTVGTGQHVGHRSITRTTPTTGTTSAPRLAD